MSKEKQIEEMAEVICIARRRLVYSEEIAEALYNAGYRKQSETVDAFVARAKDSMELMPTVYKSFYGKMLDRVACEMKGGAE